MAYRIVEPLPGRMRRRVVAPPSVAASAAITLVAAIRPDVPMDMTSRMRGGSPLRGFPPAGRIRPGLDGRSSR